ncbi:DUF6864 domain-containing function [Sinorhizobium meliloti]|uniref:DUF6864 domain-containing function n=1 Tax=Rhizobium meliloti TaxID=382 RepID=UPI0012960AD0|nr:hypothetical protein [Sinorhizobium meliloti]MQU69072.1 hypothetical protein [Sinorhizobium meliloti]
MIILSSNRLGSNAIVNSGSFVLPGDATAFSLPFEDLRFKISFHYESGGTHNIKVLGSTDKTVDIALVNFDNPLGVTWESQVASINGMPLSLALNVVTISSPSGKPRIVTYSLIKRIA